MCFFIFAVFKVKKSETTIHNKNTSKVSFPSGTLKFHFHFIPNCSALIAF